MAAPLSSDSNSEHPGLHPGFETGARLWLLRHAEVREDHQGRAYGNEDVPLSEGGRDETVRLAKAYGQMDLATVVSSPLSRARLLAEGIARQSKAPLVIEPGLAEIDRGSWQGQAVADLPSDQVADFYADPWTWREHGGENDAQLLARVWPVVAEYVAKHASRELVFVAHYNVIRVIAAHALGVRSSRSFSFRIDPGRAALLTDVRAEPAETRTEIPQTSGWVLFHSNVSDPHAIVGLSEREA